MPQMLCNFFQKQFNSFVPVWQWKLTVGKKQGIGYNRVLLICRNIQYLVAAVAILLTLSFEFSRELIASAAVKQGLLLFLFEILTYLILGYCLGLKRLPANYIPLVIMKFFVVLEKQFRPQVNDFELKVLRDSRYQGQWSTFVYKPSAGVIPIPVETQIRHATLMALSLLGMWAITKLTAVDLSRQESTALVSTSVATSAAALLLVSTFAFEDYPEFKPIHRQYCELWIIFAATNFVFILLFFFQRLYKFVNGKMKPGRDMIRMHWESVIFILAFYIMLRYIPVIHKGTNTRDLLADKTSRVGQSVIPSTMWSSSKVVSEYFYYIGEKIAKAQAQMFGSNSNSQSQVK